MKLAAGPRTAVCSVTHRYFFKYGGIKHNKYIKSHRLTNRRKTGNFDAILFLSSAAGLAQSVERLTAKRKVAGSIPGAGPILKVLK